MAFTLQIVQGGSTLVNLIDGTNFALVDYKDGTKMLPHFFYEDTLQIDILGGGSVDTMASNLETLAQVLHWAAENLIRFNDGRPYTPIYLKRQLPNGTYLLQTEIFGEPLDNLDALMQTATIGALLEKVSFKILHRGYWEETADVNLINAAAVSNDLAQISLTAPRGDLPCPLRIQVTPGTVSIEDQMLAALLTHGTLANHVFRLEADSGGASGYTVGFGTDAAAYVDANFSSGNGVEITPTGTTEAQRVLWTLDGSGSKPVSDQIHRVRLFLRGYELAGKGSGYKFRLRIGLYNSTTYMWENPIAQFTQQTVTAGTYTTSVPLIDCGEHALPDIASDSNQNFKVVVELEGQAAGGTLTGTLAKTASNTTIVGTSTLFTSELVVGQNVTIPGGGGNDTVIVSSITDNTHFVCTVAPTHSASGQTATTPGPKFRADCVYVLPVAEGGLIPAGQSGYCAFTFPQTLDASNLGVINGQPGAPEGYLADGSNNVQLPYQSKTGLPLFLRPNKASVLYVLTRLSSGAQTHRQNQTHTVSVWYRPRYAHARGV